MPLLELDVSVLAAGGCEIADQSHQMMKHLLGATGNDPCTTGCAFFDHGRCRAYKTYHSKVTRIAALKDKKPAPGKSVKQLAIEQGISISEVRRRKLAGTL